MNLTSSNNLKNLNKLNNERIFWLRISAFVVLTVVLTIFNWPFLIKYNLIWAVNSVGLIIAIVWWYWTMSIIRKLVSFKTVETEIMNELILDIKEIKQDIKKNINKDS